MNVFLAAIQHEGAKYGMKLNQSKCEALVFGGRANMKVEDGTQAKQVDEAKFLGCFLNAQTDTGREVQIRLRAAYLTAKRMHDLWRRSNRTTEFKFQVALSVRVCSLEGQKI